MTEIINQLLQGPLGVSLIVLMGLVMLTFFLWYGFFVIILPSASLISTFKIIMERHRRRVKEGGGSEEYTPILNPHLGLTMADGGKSIEKKEKE